MFLLETFSDLWGMRTEKPLKFTFTASDNLSEKPCLFTSLPPKFHTQTLTQQKLLTRHFPVSN